MLVQQLHLRSIGLVLGLKRPIDNKTASFLTDIFSHKNFADSLKVLDEGPECVNEIVFKIITDCTHQLSEKKGRLHHAISTAMLALRAAGILKDEIKTSEALALSGWVNFKAGRFEEALSYVKKAKAKFEELGCLDRVSAMEEAMSRCERAIMQRGVRTDETCDICGRNFPCEDGRHVVLSLKHHTFQKAAHCHNCGIVVCFGCADWRQAKEFIGDNTEFAKDMKSPHCPLCGGTLG